MRQLTIEEANERERIIFGRDYDENKYGGMTQHFEISPSQARELIRKGYLDPEDTQNYSPTAKELVDFCTGEDEDNWTIHGYTVGIKRDDCRVTIEGIAADEMPSYERFVEYVKLCKDADEFRIQDYGDYALWCWWD